MYGLMPVPFRLTHYQNRCKIQAGFRLESPGACRSWGCEARLSGTADFIRKLRLAATQDPSCTIFSKTVVRVLALLAGDQGSSAPGINQEAGLSACRCAVARDQRCSGSRLPS